VTPVPRRVEKPWGHEEIWAETPRYVGKLLVVRAGHRLSLQHHEKKDESLRVLHGEVRVWHGTAPEQLSVEILCPGAVLHLPPGTIHRFEALTDVELIEVSTPELDDVVRHADDYGRAAPSSPPRP